MKYLAYVLIPLALGGLVLVALQVFYIFSHPALVKGASDTAGTLITASQPLVQGVILLCSLFFFVSFLLRKER